MTDSDSAQIFRVEAQDLFDAVEQGLLDLERNSADPDAVARLFRALHTLKGSGAMFGFDVLAEIAHHCETAFDRIRKGEAAVTAELICAVLAALDQMRGLADAQSVSDEEIEAMLAVLEEVGGKPVRADPLSPPASPAPAPPSAGGMREWHIRMRFPPQAFVGGTRPLVMLDELRDLGAAQVTAVTDAIPPLEALAATECHLGWDVTLTTEAERGKIEEIFAFDALTMELEIHPSANSYAGAADADAKPAQASVPPSSSAAASDEKPGSENSMLTPADKLAAKPRLDETIRVPAARLNELMDRVGELVIAQSRLRQVADTIADETLHVVAEEVERLASDLREAMMSVRMVPVSQLFGRFRRLVHDLSHETGKKIAYVTEGEATELDKTVIERLADPLIHLIRNSADHGLETPEERLAAGKPETGRISLSARQAGGEVVITVADDGRGIDRERLRAKAVEKGLVREDEELSDTALLQLIFHPGFSTAKNVTEISGRGVGMDAVKRAIEALRGTIDLSSDAGAGARVHLRLPLTLAIIDGLLVRVDMDFYVIPLSAVEECLELKALREKQTSGRRLISLRERFIPFLCLREIFEGEPVVGSSQKLIVISNGTELVGLVVDEILGHHQTVIKPLSCFHTRIGMFSGATILGDGSLALILDTASLVSRGREWRTDDTAYGRAVGE